MTRALLLRLCAAALLSGGVSSPAAQTVVHRLDKGYPEDQYYFLTYNAVSALTLASKPEAVEGRSAQADWRITSGDGDLGYAGFGYLHRTAARPVPDLSTSTHLSLWFDNVAPAPDPERVTFRFELHEDAVETDAQGFRGSSVWVYETDAILPTPPGWTELLIPLEAVQEVGADGFAIPPGAFVGDGRLDLSRIRHWAIVLVAEGLPEGTVIEGATRFDSLTAVSSPVPSDPEAQVYTSGLGQAFPNPFAQGTTVPFTLASSTEVTLRVVDVLGRVVAVPVSGDRFDAGAHRVRLDGGGLSPGTYALILETSGGRWTRSVTHVR